MTPDQEVHARLKRELEEQIARSISSARETEHARRLIFESLRLAFAPEMSRHPDA